MSCTPVFDGTCHIACHDISQIPSTYIVLVYLWNQFLAYPVIFPDKIASNQDLSEQADTSIPFGLITDGDNHKRRNKHSKNTDVVKKRSLIDIAHYVGKGFFPKSPDNSYKEVNSEHICPSCDTVIHIY